MRYLIIFFFFISITATAQPEVITGWKHATGRQISKDVRFSTNKDTVIEEIKYRETQRAFNKKGEPVYRTRTCSTTHRITYDLETFRRHGCVTTGPWLIKEAERSERYTLTDGEYKGTETFQTNELMSADTTAYDLDNYNRPASNSKKELHLAYLTKKQNWRVYLSANVTGLVTDAITTLENSMGSNETYIYRSDATRAGAGYSGNLQFGTSYRHKHKFFVEGSILRQFLKAENVRIDWQTGLAAALPDSTVTYRFHWRGVGLGYNYSGYENLVNFEFEVAFNKYWRSNQYIVAEPLVPVNSIKYGIITGRLAMGINWRPTYRWSMRLMPGVIYGFTPVNKEVLKTKLFSPGLTLGTTVYFCSKK